MMDYYRMLWSRIGGRPWTYIARDVYHKVEYLVLVSLVVAGYTVGQTGLVNWRWFLVNMAVYTIGYIHGHFFWGKEYVPGQKANGTPK
jgi:RimJ/RimL family protein N-acetyltransferase